MTGGEIAEGSIGNAYFPFISGKKEMKKKINDISREFSEWMVYVCIKHKLEEHVRSLSILNFKLCTHLPFRDFTRCTLKQHKALSSHRRAPPDLVKRIQEFH